MTTYSRLCDIELCCQELSHFLRGSSCRLIQIQSGQVIQKQWGCILITSGRCPPPRSQGRTVLHASCIIAMEIIQRLAISTESSRIPSIYLHHNLRKFGADSLRKFSESPNNVQRKSQEYAPGNDHSTVAIAREMHIKYPALTKGGWGWLAVCEGISRSSRIQQSDPEISPRQIIACLETFSITSHPNYDSNLASLLHDVDITTDGTFTKVHLSGSATQIRYLKSSQIEGMRNLRS